MQFTHPSYSMVFMMNPSVGLTVFTSSFISFLTIVVLPALSRPLRWHKQSWLNNNVRPQTASIFSSLCPLIGLCAILKAFYISRRLFQWTRSVAFGNSVYFKGGKRLICPKRFASLDPSKEHSYHTAFHRNSSICLTDISSSILSSAIANPSSTGQYSGTDAELQGSFWICHPPAAIVS